jgi:myo-inositol-1(or 4)-monophosphatase
LPAADLSDDRAILHRAVEAASRLALDHIGAVVRLADKTDGTPVSEADLAVDAYLKETLLAARPAYGWLSEETVDDPVRLEARRLWIVDPIDGTKSLLEGSDEWVVSVALVELGRPLLAAVANPVRGEFYEAERGRGARRNGRPIAASARSEIAGCRMLANRRAFAASRWPTPWPVMETTSCKSMAYRLCQVADGRFDATLAISGKQDWDLAAAHLVIDEAGGRLTAFDGAEIVYNRASTRHQTTVAAGTALHKALLERTKHYAGRNSAPADDRRTEAQ